MIKLLVLFELLFFIRKDKNVLSAYFSLLPFLKSNAFKYK